MRAVGQPGDPSRAQPNPNRRLGSGSRIRSYFVNYDTLVGRLVSAVAQEIEFFKSRFGEPPACVICSHALLRMHVAMYDSSPDGYVSIRVNDVPVLPTSGIRDDVLFVEAAVLKPGVYVSPNVEIKLTLPDEPTCSADK